jgi:uncharacterized membrane protein
MSQATMGDFSTFYMVSSAAAATLIGLLFIAIQFNIGEFADDPSNPWRAIARSTFAVYVLLFVLPMIFLVPGLTTEDQAWVLILGALFGIFRAFRTWWPVWRVALQHGSERWLQLVRLLLGPLLIYLLFAGSGVELLRGKPASGVEFGVALTLIGLFVIALANSWNLLVELTYEKRRVEKKLHEREAHSERGGPAGAGD